MITIFFLFISDIFVIFVFIKLIRQKKRTMEEKNRTEIGEIFKFGGIWWIKNQI